MKLLHSSIFKIIIVCLLFITLLMGVGELTPVKWGFNERQIIMDIVIVLIAMVVNKIYFKQKVSWFSKREYQDQVVTLLPALVFIVITDSAVFVAPNLTFKWSVLFMCIFVAIAEEYYFRGLLIPLFLKVFQGNAYWAVIGSSVLFGLMHSVNLRVLSFGYVSIQVIFAMSLGLLFGAIYVRTDNLFISIFLHFLRDVAPLLLPDTMKNAANMSFSPITLIFCVMIFILALFIAHKQTLGIEKTEIN